MQPLNLLRKLKGSQLEKEIEGQLRATFGKVLILQALLTPLKKFELEYSLDALHNNIQNVGLSLSTSILARNVFRGAENLELAFRGSIGASKDAADREDQFFDVREFGADLKLSFPRIFFPINTSKETAQTQPEAEEEHEAEPEPEARFNAKRLPNRSLPLPPRCQNYLTRNIEKNMPLLGLGRMSPIFNVFSTRPILLVNHRPGTSRDPYALSAGQVVGPPARGRVPVARSCRQIVGPRSYRQLR